MKNQLILTIILTLPLISFGYSEAEDTIFWREKAELIPLNEKDIAYGDATILEDNRFVNYKSRSRETTRHKIVYIKTQEGLDDNNKVVIYVPNSGAIKNIKARSISKDGDIVELNENNIKEIDDYSDNGNLKVFAIEGAEVGGQIEYTYTLKTPLYDSGLELYSMDYKTVHGCMLIRCYDFFEIDSKARNWEGDDVDTRTENLYIFENILPIAQEKYATPKANRLAVEHKLLGGGTSETLYSDYDNVLAKLNKDFFEFTNKELKKAKSYLKKFEGVESDDQETLKNLTAYLKSKVFYQEKYNQPNYENVLVIMKSGVANDVGLTKFYCLLVQSLGIEYEVLVSCNKYSARLDPGYCSRNTTDEFILYFPSYKTYLYPSSQVTHYGMVPSWLAGNTGMIVHPSKRFARFKEIESAPHDENLTALTINIDMDLGSNSSVFNIDAFGTGQLAFSHNYDMYYADSDKEKQQELEGYVKWRYPDAEIQNVSMVDPEKWGDIGACEDYECRRSFKAKVKSASFFNRVGDKLLVNVGTLLGPQTELYSETERVQPITTGYNKSYSFTINIPVPDGYKYSGDQNGIIDNTFKNDDGEFVAGFKSTINVVDNVVQIQIDEFYAFVNIDKKYYEDYRRVINSAADFNKAILLFEKV